MLKSQRIVRSKGVIKMTADQLEYNKLLDRFYKALDYFENGKIP